MTHFPNGHYEGPIDFFTNPSKLKLKHSLGAYYNKKKCAKSPRDHFIDPQTQATFFVWENGHFQHLEMHISQHRGRSKQQHLLFCTPGTMPDRMVWVLLFRSS